MLCSRLARSAASDLHVLVSDDNAAGLLDRGGDGFPVVGIESAQVEDFDIDVVLALGALGGLQGAGDESAVGDEREVSAGTDDASLAEGDGEIRAGIGRAVVGLA